MDDFPKNVLKEHCCTCLSRDRKLSQLCRLKEGINNLYSLLSQDKEAYTVQEGFSKYSTRCSWYICWECWAILTRISKFRAQACDAQCQLLDIVEGRTDNKLLKACLSHLTVTQRSSPDLEIIEQDIADNFIDCGLDIKSESEEDIPLSLLHNNSHPVDRINSDEEDYEELIPLSLLHDSSDPDDCINSDKEDYEDLIQPQIIENEILPQIIKVESVPLSKENNENVKKKKTTVRIKKNKESAPNENQPSGVVKKQYFCTAYMNDIELNARIAKLKLDAVFTDAQFKCESCVEVYKSKLDLDHHISQFHTEKEEHKQCDICLVYIRNPTHIFAGHRLEHYTKHVCQLCDYIAYNLPDISQHLKSVHGHAVKSLYIIFDGKKCDGEQPISRRRRNQRLMDERTPDGWLCPECDQYFENKAKRWNHIYKEHREGYRCDTCDLRFIYKSQLRKHIIRHQKKVPLEKCPVCHKMVQVYSMRSHALTHTERDRYKCAECNKTFVSRDSYKQHMTFSRAHATPDMLKYKCSTCGKGYRTPCDLRDHMNYNHTRETQHKCPICGKVLANAKVVKVHVQRIHEGVKEKKDKICQQCGKTFCTKRLLREHELTHTGERPLSCDICGDTFRQSASLYTHKRRVHKMNFTKKITLLETAG